MPIITNASCRTPAIALEEPFDVDISVRTNTPGPVSFHFTLADDAPYFILANAEPTKSYVCRRSFGTAEENDAHFVLQIRRIAPTAVAPSLKVTASGLDGTSLPVHLGLSIE